MGFWKLFGESLREYRTNFKAIFWFIFSFIFIPLLIAHAIMIGYYSIHGYSPESLVKIGLSWEYALISILLVIVQIFFVFFTNAGLVVSSLKKKKFRFYDLTNNAKKAWFGFLMIGGIAALSILPLFFIFVVPALIMGIYWLSGVYVKFDEKRSSWQSLMRSQELIRGNWWKVFRYLILFEIIIGAVVFILNIPIYLVDFQKEFLEGSISFGQYALWSGVNSITYFLQKLIYYPIGAIFFKNLYFNLKMKKPRANEKYLNKISKRNKIMIMVGWILAIIVLALIFAIIAALVLSGDSL